ncbi:MAG: exonuclease SbcCD subunit D [Lachnospiraceae bacterium]|nr:exonuclease SbcCD subunit D [Lachnospiraceae bacterium]
MRFFHLSDLHIGKQLHNYTLYEEQSDILNQIVEKTKEFRPDVILISGDIFDRTVPSGEAYELFDQFLLSLSKTNIPVFIIAGNHDSPKRLSYASTFLKEHNIHISVMPPTKEDEFLKKIILDDKWGSVTFYLLPFTKPSYIRHLFSEGEITDYDSAIKHLLEREEIDFSKRNVILSHQFYQAGDWETKTCDSEQILISVGGTDRVDAILLKDFDYSALGHLHGAQRVKFSSIRYSGSPLKYSISEEHHTKAILMVELEEKGTPAQITSIPLTPLREVRTEKGKLEDILECFSEGCDDYVRVILTDEIDPVRPKEKLSAVFSHLLEYRVDNQRTRQYLSKEETRLEKIEPMEAFDSFYQEIHKIPLTKSQKTLLEEIMMETEKER